MHKNLLTDDRSSACSSDNKKRRLLTTIKQKLNSTISTMTVVAFKLILIFDLTFRCLPTEFPQAKWPSDRSDLKSRRFKL
jgi:hypothetical protein